MTRGEPFGVGESALSNSVKAPQGACEVTPRGPALPPEVTNPGTTEVTKFRLGRRATLGAPVRKAHGAPTGAHRPAKTHTPPSTPAANNDEHIAQMS